LKEGKNTEMRVKSPKLGGGKGGEGSAGGRFHHDYNIVIKEIIG